MYEKDKLKQHGSPSRPVPYWCQHEGITNNAEKWSHCNSHSYICMSVNPNPRGRKAYLTRNRVSNNVVATSGFDPRTSRTPAPWTSRPSHCVSLPGQRFRGHLSVAVMTQSHLMHFLSSILRRSRRLGSIRHAVDNS